MGLDPSEEELQDMIREVDEDQSGSISFVEFVGSNDRGPSSDRHLRLMRRYGQESGGHNEELTRRTISSIPSLRYSCVLRTCSTIDAILVDA